MAGAQAQPPPRPALPIPSPGATARASSLSELPPSTGGPWGAGGGDTGAQPWGASRCLRRGRDKVHVRHSVCITLLALILR